MRHRARCLGDPCAIAEKKSVAILTVAVADSALYCDAAEGHVHREGGEHRRCCSSGPSQHQPGQRP